MREVIESLPPAHCQTSAQFGLFSFLFPSFLDFWFVCLLVFVFFFFNLEQ